MAKNARKPAKAPGKTTSSPTATIATVDDNNVPAPSNPEHPETPFEPAPPNLLPFTRTLPRNHVFVAHVEKTPPALRRKAFLVPVVLNLLITAGLCWRIYYAAPQYLEQIITIFGWETQWTVDHSSTGTKDSLRLTIDRTILLLIDYGIFGILGRWPWEFVFGDKYGRYTGVCGWRWEVGFNETEEVIVRRGRKWDSALYGHFDKKQSHKRRNHDDSEKKTWTKEGELTVYTKGSEALKKFTTAKTALSLLDQDWDLDYCAMLGATHLIAKKKLRLEDVDHVVLVPWHGKWYAWYPHRTQTPDVPTENQSEAARKIEKFKQQLVDIDCEDVFYRWIEIVQYETSLTSGFTAQHKEDAEEELKKMLKARHKDDQLFFEKVGGPAGIPGLIEEG